MNNLKKYSRLFTFGCSFTQYHWPTWADILGQEAQEFQNWGLSGCGNDFILNRLIECHQRNTINKKDLVIIMWTSVTREDHFFNGRWQLNGNVYNRGWADQITHPYSVEWLLKNRSNEGYLLKTLNYITATKIILDSIGCEYYFLSMTDIDYNIDFKIAHFKTEMLELYHGILNLIKPSVHNIIYNYDWRSMPGVKIQWPGHQEKRIDPHPTPARHRDYLNKSFPDLRLSKSTEEFINRWEQKVLNLTDEDHEKFINPIEIGPLYPLPNIQTF
jgi:hypothetical protein